MRKLNIDEGFLKEMLVTLLNIHSPSGYSDQIVHFVGEQLEAMSIPFHVTRRGAIRATLGGRAHAFERALAVHLDTLGAMVRELKSNGRLGISPIGTWSSRFAEGGRVTIFTDKRPMRGTVLPLKASGHVFDVEINSQPVSWDNVEVRVDMACRDATALRQAGFEVGDFVAFDATPEITPENYINARHLDDKAGVAILLAVARAIRQADMEIPVDCHLLFTVFEEVGSGAASVVYRDLAEMVVIDHAPVAPGQNASEYCLNLGMMDQSGPFDYHLSRKLIQLCTDHALPYRKDVFRFYRSDSASAIEAGSDTRTALVCFGLDGSHGYERTHISSLIQVAQLLGLYIQSPPTFQRDKEDMAPLDGFPHQPARDVIQIKT